MATQSAHRIPMNTAAVNHSSPREEEGRNAGIVGWMKQAYCGLHGHDSLMRFEKERVYLECTSCGHETAGWELTGAAPKIVIRGDARRHALRPHLVSSRRIA